MESPKTRTLPPLERVTPGELEEALQHWEELEDTALVTLASHPISAKRFSGLRVVERWLRDQGDAADHLGAARDSRSSKPAPLDCPAPEDLFDFGRGPGFRGLGDEPEELIAQHLTGCEECAQLVWTLQTPPPLPIESEPLDKKLDGPAPRPEHRVPARPLRSSAIWRPFLVAASLAGLLLVPMYFSDRDLTAADLPQTVLYRGQGPSLLHFPRGKLLALPTPDGPAKATIPGFELAPVAGASEYRVELYRHDGGAFNAGSLIQVLRSVGAEPLLTGGDPLEPGHYTWRGWADVNGLERELGALDFQVVLHPEMSAQVSAIDDSSSIDSLVRTIVDLDGASFYSDAHTLARRLPKSPERDEYLNPPAR